MGERTLVDPWTPGAQPRSYPLGHTVSGSPHSVVVSLPKFADVIGYEEKDPAILANLRSGYPRFFLHADIRALAEALQARGVVPSGEAFLLGNGALLPALEAFAGFAPRAAGEWNGLTWCVYPPESTDAVLRVRRFLQHTGATISSRQAEDGLVALGLRAAAYPEAQYPADHGFVERELAPWFGGDAARITLTQGGMNAFYALFRAANAALAPTGRRRWVQLGWLYVDTIKILESMSPPEAPPIVWDDVSDLEGLAERLAPFSDEIVAIVAELPTNPLLQTPDVDALRAMADRLGCLLVLDPSMASISQVDVLPWADAVVTSLTKYTAREGDVMLGAVAVNSARSWASALEAALPGHVVSPYGRDLTRFAAQLRGWASFADLAARNAWRVARFLEAHPAVERVWWSGSPENAARYARIARSTGETACAVVSFTVKGPVEQFYDVVEVVKGPSFGTEYTLLSLFMYLAHYQLVTTPGGQARLAAAGVPADLLRLSVGAEPVEALLAVLDTALREVS